MLKSVAWQLYKHKFSTTSLNMMTCIKTANSYRITFSDPKTRNALSMSVLQNLIEEIKKAGDDLSLKSIVLCGNGPVFSAGHNLNELRISENQKTIFSLATKLMNTMIDCPIPIIACVDGLAAASGCQLVAASDIAICTNRSFFSTPGVSLGLFCSTPGIPLSRVMSKKTVSYMLFTGVAIDAKEALRTGLVSKVVQPEELEDEILKLTTSIGQKSRAVITLGKQFFYKHIDDNIKSAYKNGEKIMLENLELDDCKEGYIEEPSLENSTLKYPITNLKFCPVLKMLQLPKYINTILLYNRISFMTRSYGLIYSQTNQVDNYNNNNKSKFIPIYKTSHMIFFIGLNKVKKYQTAASFGMVPICFGLNILGYLSFEEVIYASLIGLGLSTGLHIASSLISNNLIVFVYISEDEQKCRISFISYWGNRKEFYCDIKDIKPIKCSKLDILNHKIKLNGNKNKYKIIVHNSIIFNNAKFRQIFGDII